jgi:hypothetical protein
MIVPFMPMRMPTPAVRTAVVSMVVPYTNFPASLVRTGFVQFRTIGGKTVDFRHSGFLERFVV